MAEAAICEELARRDRGGPAPAPSPFFSDQLTAFEVWLRLGARSSQRPPEQLPILLQVRRTMPITRAFRRDVHRHAATLSSFAHWVA